MDWQKDKFGKFEAATLAVTAEELPDLDFAKPPQDKFGLLQLHR